MQRVLNGVANCARGDPTVWKVQVGDRAQHFDSAMGGREDIANLWRAWMPHRPLRV